MKRNIRYKPSKASAAMSLVVGVVFIIIGLTMVIPATFGSGFLPVSLFGLLWTGLAAAMTVINARYLFGKGDNANFFGGYEITDEEPEKPADKWDAALSGETHDHIPTTALDAKARLEQLETLKEAGLLTKEEYDQKRREILRGL